MPRLWWKNTKDEPSRRTEQQRMHFDREPSPPRRTGRFTHEYYPFPEDQSLPPVRPRRGLTERERPEPIRFNDQYGSRPWDPSPSSSSSSSSGSRYSSSSSSSSRSSSSQSMSRSSSRSTSNTPHSPSPLREDWSTSERLESRSRPYTSNKASHPSTRVRSSSFNIHDPVHVTNVYSPPRGPSGRRSHQHSQSATAPPTLWHSHEPSPPPPTITFHADEYPDNAEIRIATALDLRQRYRRGGKGGTVE